MIGAIDMKDEDYDYKFIYILGPGFIVNIKIED